MSHSADIMILGAGAIGMMTALALRERGLSVVMVERSLPARESSWAGGGILSPLYPWRYSDAVTQLTRYGQQYYRDRHAAWRDATGVDPEWRESGLWMTAESDQAQALAWAQRHQMPLQTTAPKNIALEADWIALPTVAQMKPPRLGKVLDQLCLQQGVERLHQRGEVSLEQAQGGFQARVGQDIIATADRAVVCAGAWSGQLLKPLGVDLPVRPVRGQIVMFDAPDISLDAMVMHQQRYLIPRADGRILIGSTLEEAGFDKSTTDEALHDLIAVAAEMLPALAKAKVERQWAGLRPGSPNGTPWIGAVPGLQGLYVNAGHYRNGIILAPGSAELLAQLLNSETPFVDPVEFTSPGRI